MVDLGTDPDGDRITSLIVLPMEQGEQRKQVKVKNPRHLLALRALTEVTLSQGRDPPADYSLPQGIKVVDAETWRKELLRSKAIDPDGSNPRARFAEIRRQLQAALLIGARDDAVWLAR